MVKIITMATRKTQLTYEQSIAQLETIVERLESGQAGLEQSLTDYETGMKLIAHCKSILERTQKRIEELKVATVTPAIAHESSADDENLHETAGQLPMEEGFADQGAADDEEHAT